MVELEQSSSQGRAWYDYGKFGTILVHLLLFPLTGVLNASMDNYLTYLGMNVPPLIIVVFFSYRRFGLKDFRFNVVANTISMVTTIGAMGFVFGYENVFDNMIPSTRVVYVYGAAIPPALVIIIACIYSINNLVKPFRDSLSQISVDVKKEKYDTKIVDERVINDGIFRPMADFVNEIVGTIGRSLTELTNTSTLIANTAEELTSSAEEVNASAEEVSSTSQAMSNGATTQTELINEVNEEIKQTSKLVDEIITSIRNNTNQVSQIALQTNILALNAGIEASRAGDYGRGFAVVAENIRKLSDQSKVASESITDVADEIASRLEEAFSKISATMLNVVSVSEETAASAEEVAAAAEEMTASMEQVSSLSQELSARAEKSNITM